MVTLALCLLTAAAPSERPKLAVLDLTPGAGVDEKQAVPIVQAITVEVGNRGFFHVISQQDITTMLGVERQKQLLGCADDKSSCLAELSGALGARFVMSGTLSRLGEAYQLTLNTFDTQKAQPLGRATRLAKDLESLQAMIPYAAAEATATPMPAPPSKVLPFTLIGVGAAAAAVGLVLGTITLNTQGALRSELELGATRPGVLDTRDRYQAQISELDRNKGIAIASILAGAALVATGIVMMPKDVGATAVAFVPIEHGGLFALSGVLP